MSQSVFPLSPSSTAKSAIEQCLLDRLTDLYAWVMTLQKENSKLSLENTWLRQELYRGQMAKVAPAQANS